MRIFLTLGISLFLGVSFLQAQTWSQRLSAAERDYEEGRLANIPERLQGGFLLKSKEGGYSKEETVRALKLITKVYIFLDDEPNAEDYLVRLLKADKEHKLDPRVDPAELYFLYNQFRTKPIFRISLKTGVNKSFPQVMQTFSPSNTLTVKKLYNGVGEPPGTATAAGAIGMGYWADLVAERHLRWGVEVGTGVGVRNSSYDVDNFVGESAGGEPTLLTHISNQQLNFWVPLLMSYADYRSDFDLKIRALQLLDPIGPESNNILNHWKKCHITPVNLTESQGLIQLYKYYCSNKLCLNCRIGKNILTLNSN